METEPVFEFMSDDERYTKRRFWVKAVWQPARCLPQSNVMAIWAQRARLRRFYEGVRTGLFAAGRLLRTGARKLFIALQDRAVRRRFLRYAIGGSLAVLCLVGLLSLRVSLAARGRVYTLDSVPAKDVAIVFGAGVFPDGSLATPLADRVVTAVELYRAGKVRKLLMSGDNGRQAYNEPQAMMAVAVAMGVRPVDVALDYAGFHTYDTCYRAKAVFDVQSAVLVTQRYHLARSLFTCQGVGLDVVGVAADKQRYSGKVWYVMREQVSRAVAYIRVRITHPRPRFVGPRLPIRVS